MSDGGARPSSPSPSVSLLEAKEETRQVLRSFVRKALTVPPDERPGRVGGSYLDPKKFSAAAKSPKTPKKEKADNGWDSVDEAISAAEEKKHSIKNLIKRRLRPRSIRTEEQQKNKAGTLERKTYKPQSDQPISFPDILQKNLAEDGSSSSFSEEEGGDGEKKKKKKSKRKLQSLASIFRPKNKTKEPQRPVTLPVPSEPAAPSTDPQLSPSHSPEFYNEVASTLHRIARKSKSVKLPPVIPPPPAESTTEPDKNAIVQQLVQILCKEGDLLNDKITANPFLRKSLDRMSYPSFAKLLDTYASQTVVEVEVQASSSSSPTSSSAPLPASPTLRKVAITMEASRRVLTATGERQRMRGYAEKYMERFAPWVKSHGGWENIVEEIPEYD